MLFLTCKCTLPINFHCRVSQAGVAELEDAPDLGSGALGACGFESRLPHYLAFFSSILMSPLNPLRAMMRFICIL